MITKRRISVDQKRDILLCRASFLNPMTSSKIVTTTVKVASGRQENISGQILDDGCSLSHQIHPMGTDTGDALCSTP